MPYAVSTNTNSTGTKTFVIPAPPAGKQETLIHKIYLHGFSASGAAQAVVTLIMSGDAASQYGATQIQFGSDPCAALAGASCTFETEFREPISIRNASSPVTASADSRPNSHFANMNIIVNYSYR